MDGKISEDCDRTNPHGEPRGIPRQISPIRPQLNGVSICPAPPDQSACLGKGEKDEITTRASSKGSRTAPVPPDLGCCLAVQ
jgi:hypothetical protein